MPVRLNSVRISANAKWVEMLGIQFHNSLSEDHVMLCCADATSNCLGQVWLKYTVYPKKYAHGFCFAVLCCGYTLIFSYPSGLLHWHCGNLTIAPVPAKQPWWIWINTSCEFIMNDCITTTKQSTTKPCAYFLGYTVCHHMSSLDHNELCFLSLCH